MVQVNPNSAHDDHSVLYPEESIGRLMTSEFVAVLPEFTVAEALSHIRRHGKECETLNTIYVVDMQGSLVDEIDLSKIVLASLDQRISELVGRRYTPQAALEDQELAIKQFQENDAVALPVVDGSGTLLGIVTVDDVMDVAAQESLADFQKFGAIQHAIANPIARPKTGRYCKTGLRKPVRCQVSSQRGQVMRT